MPIVTSRYFLRGVYVPNIVHSLDPVYAANFNLLSLYRPQMVDVSYSSEDQANLDGAMDDQGWSPAGINPTQPIRLTGLAANILPTVLTPIYQEGTYQIVMYANCTTIGLGSVNFTFTWTDAGGPHTVTAASLNLTGSNFAQSSLNIHALPGTNVTYAATIVGGPGLGVFSLYAALAYLF